MFKPVASGPVAVVPREQVGTWERWQAHDLALSDPLEPVAAAEPEAVPEDPAERAAREAAEHAAAQAAELAAVREAARREGLKAGRTEGLKQGHEEGYAKGHTEGVLQGKAQGMAEGQQAALQQAKALAALLEHCHTSASQFHAQVAPALVRLALSVAHKVVGHELQTRPETLVGWVENLLHSEPATDGMVKLHLHPDDATLVAAQLGPALSDHQWRLVPDESIQRGGCRLISPLGELDATLATRWQQACLATGLEPPWTLG